MSAKLCRLFSVFASLVICVGVGHAQPSPGGLTSAACQVSSTVPLSELEKRRQALERKVAHSRIINRIKATLARLGILKSKSVVTTPNVANGAKGYDDDLRKSQEELLQVLFQIDCQRSKGHMPTGLEMSRSIQSVEPAIEVTTYYATNRKRTTNVEPAKLYGPRFQSTFEYGRATVTIPPTHMPGNLEMPSLWKLERDADPNKHFVLKAVVPLNADAARKEMAKKLGSMGSKDLLVFVHGYYTGFADAALRTAQMAHDLKFPGMAFFYSWPSANTALGYWQDEEASQLSEGVFEQLLGELSQLPVTDIYIVAHSMGNRIVTSALRSRVEKKEETKHIRELLLAAPDINAELFRTTIAPKLAAMQGMQTTIYASSSDLALKASKVVHGFTRIGDTIGGVFVYPGFDTIDASGASTMTRAYGHSYLMDSSSVLKDIQAIIQEKLAAKQRGLPEMGTSPNQYWQLK
jgi:esterase/lipase superfamily enzyme